MPGVELIPTIADCGVRPLGVRGFAVELDGEQARYAVPGQMNGKRCAGLTPEVDRNDIDIVLRAVHVSIRQMGTSHGAVIPKDEKLAMGESGNAEDPELVW